MKGFEGYLAYPPSPDERWEGQACFREKREKLGLQSKCLILLVIELIWSSLARFVEPRHYAR